MCAATFLSPGSSLLLQRLWESLLERRASCFPGHLSLPTPQIEVAQSAAGIIATLHYALLTHTIILWLWPWRGRWEGGREESHRECLSILNITNRNTGKQILRVLALLRGPWTSRACPMRQLLTWSDFIHQVLLAVTPACLSSLLPPCWGDRLHNSLHWFLSASSLSVGVVSSDTTQLWV